MDIRQYLLDPMLAGVAYAEDSWRAWRIVLAGAMALPLSLTELDTFAALTGGRTPLTAPCSELYLLIGRRGGKDSIAAAIACYLACLRSWKLSIGEVGVVLVLAADRDQAKVAFRYIKGLLEASPLLAQEVESTTADRITLRSGIEIQVGTSDYAAVRGRTLLCVIADELAFWGIEQATEVLRAVRPGMASQRQAMLIAITTVYSQRGPVFDTYRRFFGVDNPRVLVVRATTREMNPTISEDFIADELERDPAAAAAEYLSQFRSDLEGFIDQALLDRATRRSVRDIPFARVSRDGALTEYFAAVDVSGGRNDATAAAVAHMVDGRVVIDACRRWPSPHDPVAVAGEVAAFLAEYGLQYTVADQYGAELSRAIYSEAGLALSDAPLNRSEAYLALLPLFTSDRIELPDDPRLRMEFLALERRTGKTGKDAIDHCVGQHDDLANAVALAAVSAFSVTQPGDSQLTVVESRLFDGLNGNDSIHARYASIFDVREGDL